MNAIFCGFGAIPGVLALNLSLSFLLIQDSVDNTVVVAVL